MSYETDLLERILNAQINSGNNVTITGTQVITGGKTFTQGIATDAVGEYTAGHGVTIDPVVPDTPTNTHRGINQTYADTRYYRSYGVAANYDITGLTTLNIALITNFANCNEVTLTSSNATETINNITNLPAGVAWKVKEASGLTVTFTEKAGGTGNIRNPGAASFVAVGTNGDFGVFQTGVLASTVQRVGGNNYAA